MAATAVLAIGHGRHEDTGTTRFVGALPAKTLDLSITVHLIVLEDSQLRFLPLVLDLLGGSVNLLLPLLRTTAQAEHKVQGGFLLDVVITQGPSVLQLFTGKDEALLVWGDPFLVLDLGLDIVDGVRRFDLEGNRLTREGFDEDLHDCCARSIDLLRFPCLCVYMCSRFSFSQ